MLTSEKNIQNQIMATDIYIALSSDKYPQEAIENDISVIINQFKEFEKKYSRFINNNYLAQFNESEEFTASEEFLDLIEQAQTYYAKTKGLFDPTIYGVLLNEGYNTSKLKGFFNRKLKNPEIDLNANFSQIHINRATKTIKKPKNVRLDLGGIGKGFIVDKTAQWAKNRYKDFCIDAGGDMYLGGVDQIIGYSYWAIEIDSTVKASQELPVLMVSNKAIATSGVSGRKWIKEGLEKTHIIDPRTHHSINNDVDSVTVIGDTTVYSDVYAKTLLLSGSQDALKYSQENKIPALIIKKNGDVLISSEMEKYVWKNR